ncbi:MAG: hypothetical protein ACREJ4_13425, partial [Candidatus Methylomirabilaceae bacterium]
MKDCGATDCKKIRFALALTAALLGALTLGSSPALANCNDLPDFDTLDDKLDDVAPSGTAANGGLNNHLWATIVDRDGIVCAVARTGGPGDQWPGSRVISAQKANTANAFSLPGLALSTANLFSAVQPGGSLYGLQHS